MVGSLIQYVNIGLLFAAIVIAIFVLSRITKWMDRRWPNRRQQPPLEDDDWGAEAGDR